MIFLGNYGRSFAYAAQKMGVSGTVIMPETAPQNRGDFIRSFGIKVEKCPSVKLMENVARVSGKNEDMS